MNWYEHEYRELFTPPKDALIGAHFDKIRGIMSTWGKLGRKDRIQKHLELARLGIPHEQLLMRDVYEAYLVYLVTR